MTEVHLDPLSKQPPLFKYGSQRLTSLSAFIHYETVIFSAGRLHEYIVTLMQIRSRYFAGGERPWAKAPLINCILTPFEER